MRDQVQLPAVPPAVVRSLRWNRASYLLLSAFLATIGLIGYVWWPLLHDYLTAYSPAYPWWKQTDFLLVGIFAAMSILIMVGADLRTDVRLAAVGLIGGFAIESWGTRTGLWAYYTHERPPLWILPAWPIATLAIDRLIRALDQVVPRGRPGVFHGVQLTVLGGFVALMVPFVYPTIERPATLAALALSAFLILRTPDNRMQLLTFVAGAALGYFLEVWGTTRACWTYYTRETPPLFAVLAHGMAAVAFYRALGVFDRARNVARAWIPRPSRAASDSLPDFRP
jgi:hypothetical protein